MAEMQQQLMASHEQVRQLAAEIANMHQKLTTATAEFDRKANYLNGQVANLQQQNTQLEAKGASNSGSGYKGEKMGQLVNLKTMQPKIFSGLANESFRGWAKKVRSYCNASKTGFKKFLKWIEMQKLSLIHI